MADLVGDLSDALAPDRVRDGAVELGLYRKDASTMEGPAGVVCFPLSTAEVQSCVRIARRHGGDVRFAGRDLRNGCPLTHLWLMRIATLRCYRAEQVPGEGPFRARHAHPSWYAWPMHKRQNETRLD